MPLAVDDKVDLRSRVSGLAQAIGSFEATSPATDQMAAQGSGANGNANTPALQAVSSMVDVLKQFDANGKPLTGSALTASAPKLSTTPGLVDPNSSGYLTSGGGSLKG
jgi:hypothetical protein